MSAVKTDKSLVKQVVNTLLYYDIFNYPLKASEVFRFTGVNAPEIYIQDTLEYLVAQKHVFQFGDFYSVQPNEENITRRVKGNAEAEKYLTLAQKQALLIARFPFVRAVMASGSLSKGYMDEKSDLDFFIVTEPGRLWIARTLLVVYKRMFLSNSHKYFCVNYFVDSDHLEIEEKNLFTATELATVVPLYNGAAYNDLQEANQWIKNFFPNYKSRQVEFVPENKSSSIKIIVENFINLFSVSLERYLMRLSLNRWKKIYQRDYAAAEFQIAFKTQKHASKNHPRNYQKKVMDLYNEKVDRFTEKFNGNEQR
jgi:hypothetical protein